MKYLWQPITNSRVDRSNMASHNQDLFYVYSLIILGFPWVKALKRKGKVSSFGPEDVVAIGKAATS